MTNATDDPIASRHRLIVWEAVLRVPAIPRYRVTFAPFADDFVARKGEEAVERNLPDVDKSSGNQRPPEAAL